MRHIPGHALIVCGTVPLSLPPPAFRAAPLFHATATRLSFSPYPRLPPSFARDSVCVSLCVHLCVPRPPSAGPCLLLPSASSEASIYFPAEPREPFHRVCLCLRRACCRRSGAYPAVPRAAATFPPSPLLSLPPSDHTPVLLRFNGPLGFLALAPAPPTISPLLHPVPLLAVRLLPQIPRRDGASQPVCLARSSFASWTTRRASLPCVRRVGHEMAGGRKQRSSRRPPRRGGRALSFERQGRPSPCCDGT
jgi:hypothetical protein